MNENVEKYQFNMNVATSDGIVTILHGNALDPKYQIPLVISGNIETPAKFWAIRKDDFDNNNCYVVRSKIGISLIVNENSPVLRGCIDGAIKLNDECSKFLINCEHLYDRQDLARLIKANEFLFTSRTDWLNIYNSLVDFDGKVELAILDKKEANGDREKALKITVKKGIACSFKLKTKIYGSDRVEYSVDLNAEVVGHDVKFYLDSSDLAYKMSESEENLLNEYSDCFVNDGVLVIDK